MLTTELEDRLKNPGVFDEELIENNAPPELTDVLSKYIDESNISKADVIRILNVDRNYGYQMLNGTRIPTRNILIRLAIMLGLDIEQTDYLLKLAGKPMLYVRNVVDARIFYSIKHQLSYEKAMMFIWDGDDT